MDSQTMICCPNRNIEIDIQVSEYKFIAGWNFK